MAIVEKNLINATDSHEDIIMMMIAQWLLPIYLIW